MIAFRPMHEERRFDIVPGQAIQHRRSYLRLRPVVEVRVTFNLALGNEYVFDDFLEFGRTQQTRASQCPLSFTRRSISETASSSASVMPICSRL